jgi:catechol 2,3-dioxygenase-like lactoylglutathione lyase family enzyme
MLSHFFIGVNDFPRCFSVYSAIMAVLGHELRFCESDRPWAGWLQPGQPRPLVVIAAPDDCRPAAPGPGQMVALLAQSRAQVDAARAVGLAAGGTDAGAPRLRPQYHPDFDGAYLQDPDGNRIGLACHAPDSQAEAQNASGRASRAI